jgi:hypothetical protein
VKLRTLRSVTSSPSISADGSRATSESQSRSLLGVMVDAREREGQQRQDDPPPQQGEEQAAEAQGGEGRRQRPAKPVGQRQGEPQRQRAPGGKRHHDETEEAGQDEAQGQAHEACSTAGWRVSSTACCVTAGETLPSPSPARVTVGKAKWMSLASNAFLIMA